MRAARALDRGLRYVLESQDASGAWVDFEVDGAVESDAWVTGYVGRALCDLRGSAERPLGAAIAAARARMEQALTGRGGWGYHLAAPVDADSTAWVTLLLQAAGGEPNAAYDTLRKHRRDDGGFSTYVQFSDPSMWRASQVDVSAVALQALLGESPLDADTVGACAGFLCAQQRTDGSWPSYWYACPLYTIAHALDALAALERTAAAPRAPYRAHDAVAFAVRNVRPGDPFSLAHALRIVLLHGDAEPAAGLVDELVRLQRPDGRWTAAEPVMRPDPWNYAGGDTDAAVFDQYGLFTTATVLRALALAVAAPVAIGAARA
jgi:hypothetical protein